MTLIQVKKPWPWSYQQTDVTVWPFLFYLDEPLEGSRLDHELIHAKQQVCWLWLPWFVLYILFLPVGFNPFRYRWEFKAYRNGSGYGHSYIRWVLSTSTYGWLIPSLHRWLEW